ncbi:hypothetical protein BB934_22360 [Microvirga ossetica]|uniref:DUF927 domain-containing protein n=1 Tax=Microvirga ossetica TaxID=1882682 RepID=A0A1B2EKW3_9HYPH|nr:DUF927 domain-containing protein [Microvirga ossetica]ANY80633.1 hypothetical protein BB934_22360 [Microvirga ossetica]
MKADRDQPRPEDPEPSASKGRRPLTREETVQYLAALDPDDYAEERTAAAKELTMSLNALDKAVKAERRRQRQARWDKAAPAGLAKGHENRDGFVWFEGDDGWIKICSDIRVEARLLDSQGSNPALLLSAPHGSGRREALLSEALIVRDANKAAARLVEALNVSIHSPNRDALAAVYPPPPVAEGHYLDRTGWFLDDNGRPRAFALPSRVIFDQAGPERFCLDGISHDGSFRQRGSLEQWKQRVAGAIARNPVLVMAVATFLAAPLIPLLRSGSIANLILHIVDQTSTGKTTALKVASSVWGPPDRYLRHWRSTGNGVESLAASRAHTGLALDEVAQLDPDQVSVAIYMLSSGQGKSRSDVDGALRSLREWETFILSTGEKTLREHAAVRRANRRPQSLDPGTDARLIDVESAVVTDHDGFASSKSYVDHLAEMASTFHGTAGPAVAAWLLTDNVDAARERLAAHLAAWNRLIGHDLSPRAVHQARRIAASLGQLAALGAVAAEALELPWGDGDPGMAVLEAARYVLSGRLQATRGGEIMPSVVEDVDALRSWIVRNQDNFAGVPAGQYPGPLSGLDRSAYADVTFGRGLKGWFNYEGEALISISILPDALKDDGWTPERLRVALGHLRESGLLITGSDRARLTVKQKSKLHGKGRRKGIWVYQIRADFLNVDDGDEGAGT